MDSKKFSTPPHRARNITRTRKLRLEQIRAAEKMNLGDEENFDPNYTQLVEQIMVLQQTLQEERRRNTEKDILISHLKKEAYTDELTGIFNRRGLLQAFTDLTHHDDGVVVLVDLDKFKPINDTFGHDAGDAALKLVARCLVDNTRHDTDIVARYGGDEFLVVLKGAEANEVGQRIRKLDTAINSLSFDWQHDGSNVSIKLGGSLGHASFKAGDDMENAKTKADKELYKIKKQKGHKRYP